MINECMKSSCPFSSTFWIFKGHQLWRKREKGKSKFLVNVSPPFVRKALNYLYYSFIPTFVDTF